MSNEFPLEWVNKRIAVSSHNNLGKGLVTVIYFTIVSSYIYSIIVIKRYNDVVLYFYTLEYNKSKVIIFLNNLFVSK